MCQGGTCGAVTGAVMAVGLKYGQGEAKDKESKEKTNDIVKEFSNRFKQVNGKIVCKELLNFDLSKDN